MRRLPASAAVRPVAVRPTIGLLLLAATALSVVTGCQVASKTEPLARTTESVTHLSVDQLSAALTDQSDTLLVEFCVPTGCVRCAEMRDSIDRLASDRREGLTVRRVSLSQNSQLAWEFNLTACPSYVAFRDGKEVYRASHPTSADLIASGLEESLREPTAGPLSLAAQ